MADYQIEGLREVALNLDQFPEKLQRKALGAALRAGGRVVRDIARNKVPVQSGRLRRSIRVVMARSNRGFMTVRVIAGRAKKKDDPYWAIFVERGTKPHVIRPKNAKSLSIGSFWRDEVHHPGAKANAFLGPALEAGAQAALEAMRDVLAEQIDKLGGLT